MTDDLDFLEPGQPVDLDNCAREPIHLPGSIQPSGALLVARASDRTVTQASDNVGDYFDGGLDVVIGQTLEALFDPAAAERFAASAGRVGTPSVRPDRVVLASGRAVDTHCFQPEERLLAVEIAPAAESELDATSTIARVATWSADLQSKTSPDALVAAAASSLRELTGFDRVWAYRFEADGHGVVVAEDRREDLESFLGLHFPESDIPRQARALYLRNAVRVIPDVQVPNAKLVPLENPETGTWLDLSGSTLRAVSPMHLLYLGNMGVRASMSVSLVVDGKLWGLLSAHHYDGPRAVPIRVRGECELLGVLTSMQLATAAELERTQSGLELQTSVSRVLDHMAANDSFVEGLSVDPDALLGVCNANGAVIATGDQRRVVGEAPPPAAIDRLLAALAELPDDVIAIDEVPTTFPELADLAEVASGVLAVPMSRRQGNWVVWLRPESVEEVTWANRDKELVRRGPTGVMELGERESFERWAETVRGRSRPWTAAEVDAVRGLRSSLGALLITRTEALARLNEELERSNSELDAFAYAAAHDLREPVRGIEQFAGFFLEDFGDTIDTDGHAQIQTILRLAGRMDGLLSALLEYAQLGESTWTSAPVRLESIVDDVRELLAPRLTDEITIAVDPATVSADPDGLRQLLLNLVWNAIKYSEGRGRIEIGSCSLSDAEGGEPRVRRSMVGDDEPTAIYVRDHGIGIDPEYHEQIFELFFRLHAKDAYGGGAGAGLTLCRRIVERHGGVIWVDSTPGAGATFFFTLGPA
jgi:light-regulated signal transduction histidine kinase (bacteriophytochrome)